jgi:ABC-2 type transport system permease protein
MPQEYVLAARVRGTLPAAKEESGREGADAEATDGGTIAEGAGEEEAVASDAEGSEASETGTVDIDVILVADLDMFSDYLLQMLERQVGEIDNVTFVLNAVDSLAGDDSYISLRKKRRKFRTLTTIEALESHYRESKLSEENAAETDAQQKLAEAQASFDEKVRAVEERTDLDMRAKEIMIASVKKVEQDRLSARKAKIDEDKNKRLEAAHYEMQEKIRSIHMAQKAKAVIYPVIPPLIIAILVFFIRRSRENLGESKSRLLRD